MTDDDKGWEEKGIYAGYRLLARGNRRKVIDEETGEVVIEYDMSND